MSACARSNVLFDDSGLEVKPTLYGQGKVGTSYCGIVRTLFSGSNVPPCLDLSSTVVV